MKDPNLHLFPKPLDENQALTNFGNPFSDQPHDLCKKAAQELQQIIQSKQWDHNFGLGLNSNYKAIGKMFGVLVVEDSCDRIGYLAGFSGKIGERNQFEGFVPPIFDALEPGGFLDVGMKKIAEIQNEIELIVSTSADSKRIESLKKARTEHSNSLQEKIYASYQLLNGLGERKSLKEIFTQERGGNPPGGAGDCAAPRLLQYAFEREMRPIALAEFWWGSSESSPQWKHKEFYPPCTNKCKPILKHMLRGLV